MVNWALSFPLSGELSRSVRFLSNTEQDSQHTRHKKEAEGRIKTDQADRQSLRDTLDVCNDLLEYASHPDGALMNIGLRKLRTLMSMQIMPSALDIRQWKTSRVDGRIRFIALPAS